MDDKKQAEKLEKEIRKQKDMMNIKTLICFEEGNLGSTDKAVRIFDLKFVKGLQFEVIFFLDIDKLAQSKKSLFQEYLYVACTRCKKFLGLHTSNQLPKQIEWLDGMLKENIE